MPIFLYYQIEEKIHAIKITDTVNVDLTNEAIVECYLEENIEKKYSNHILNFDFKPGQGLKKDNPIIIQLIKKKYQAENQNLIFNALQELINKTNRIEKHVTKMGFQRRCIVGSHDSTQFGSQQRQNFRKQCTIYYEMDKCMVTGNKQWEAAHIIAASSAGSVNLNDFELINLWQPQNAIMLAPWLHKEHFDKGHCTIVYNALRQKYMLFVLNPFMLN